MQLVLGLDLGVKVHRGLQGGIVNNGFSLKSD